ENTGAVGSERRFLLTAPPPVREPRQAVADLGDTDRRGRELVHRHRPQPVQHHRRRRWPHHFRNHIGIKNNHVSLKSGGCRKASRRGRSSSTPSWEPNSSRAMSAAFSAARGSSDSRRILRASSSIERPCWAAWCFNRPF